MVPAMSDSRPTVVPDPPPFSQAAPVPLHDPAFVKRHYPAFLQLKLVQLIHRHGERTPERRRFVDVVPPVWELCAHGNRHHKQYMDALHRYSDRNASLASKGFPSMEARTIAVPLRPSHERAEDERPTYQQSLFGNVSKDKVHPNQDLSKETLTSASCGYGQLTDIGRRTLHRLGASLRAIYVDQLGYLPGLHTHTPDLYLRCTEYSRTFESLHQLLAGLYPKHPSYATGQDRPAPPAFNISVRAHPQENMFGDFTCARFRELSKATFPVAKEAMGEEWAGFLAKHVYPSAVGAEVRDYMVKHPGSLNTHWLYDTLIALRAHNLPLPPGITDATVDEVERLTVKEWTLPMQGNYPYLRLLSGRFLEDLLVQMAAKIRSEQNLESHPGRLPQTVGAPAAETHTAYDPAKLKLSIFSGHDSTILPLLAIFAPDLGQWPAYAAHLSLELFQDPSYQPAPAQAKEGGVDARDAALQSLPARPLTLPRESYATYFVRLRFNDQFLTLPKCAPKGRHHPQMGPTMCTFDAFYETVERLIPTDYRAECRPTAPKPPAVQQEAKDNVTN